MLRRRNRNLNHRSERKHAASLGPVASPRPRFEFVDAAFTSLPRTQPCPRAEVGDEFAPVDSLDIWPGILFLADRSIDRRPA